MALQMRRTPSRKVRIIATLAAVLALIAQPLYGLVKVQVASAVSTHITQLVFVSEQQTISKGVRSAALKVRTKNVTGANEPVQPAAKLTVISSSATGRFANNVNSALSATNTKDITISSGDSLRSFYYQDSAPGTHTITAKVSGGDIPNEVTATQSITILGSEAQLNAEEFATVEASYKGVSVGFNAKDFGTVTDVTVDMTRADGSHVVKHGNQGVFDLISNKTAATQLTAPFVIQEGAFTEASDTQYWQPAPSTWTLATTPTSVTISITDEHGTKKVTNNTFHSGAPSWPPYESLLPSVPPADTTAPDVPTILTPTDSQYFATSPILNKWTAVSDPSGIANYEIEYVYDDGHTFAGGPTRLVPGDQTSRSHQPTISEQGGVTIRVRAIDGAGNKSAYSTPVNYFYDAQAPSVTLQQPQNGDRFKKDEQFTVSAHLTDNVGLANYRLHVDGIEQPQALAASEGVALDIHVVFNANDFTNGEHTIVVWAIDKAGNESQKLTRTIWIDKTPPTITVKPESIGSDNHFKKVSFKLSDNDKVVKYFINGIQKNLTPNKWSDANGISIGKNGGKLGENTFTLVDMTGNTTTYTFWLDNVSPEGTVIYSNDNGNAATADDVTVTLTVNESIKALDGWSKIGDTAFTKIYSENGQYSVELEDLAGNTTTLHYEVKGIDRITPVINGVVNNGLYNSAITYSVTEQSIREIIVDGAVYQEGNAPYMISGDGLHIIKVVDEAGNATEVKFTIDTTPPVLTINTPQMDENTGEYSVTGHSSEGSRPIQVTWSNGASTRSTTVIPTDSGNWTLLLGALTADTQYTITASLQDIAGNSQIVTQSYITEPLDTSAGVAALPGLFTASSIFSSRSAATQTTPATQIPSDETDVKGAETNEGGKSIGEVLAAVAPSEQGWKFFGVAWYWFLIAFAVLAAAVGWIAMIRRRTEKNAAL